MPLDPVYGLLGDGSVFISVEWSVEKVKPLHDIQDPATLGALLLLTFYLENFPEKS